MNEHFLYTVIVVGFIMWGVCLDPSDCGGNKNITKTGFILGAFGTIGLVIHKWGSEAICYIVVAFFIVCAIAPREHP